MSSATSRPDGRKSDELRPLTITAGVNPYAEGSARVECGRTQLLITASVEKEIPKWMTPEKGGWITAEYGMLPRSTHTRNKREAAQGKQSGRTLEIQRLIGRALRVAIDLKSLTGLTIRLDCDVLSADGGTRTAAISGGWVALYQAIRWAKSEGLVPPEYSVKQVAAISVGVFGGQPLVDLCYEEDSAADFDMNLVFDDSLRLVEIQGTAEKDSVSTDMLSKLLLLGESSARRIMKIQRSVVEQLS